MQGTFIYTVKPAKEVEKDVVETGATSYHMKNKVEEGISEDGKWPRLDWFQSS